MLPLFLASAVAVAAWLAGTLSTSGAISAVAVGTVALLAGWPTAILLITYFISASAISRLGVRRGVRASGAGAPLDGIVEKTGARDAWQVFANGGVFTVLTLVWLIQPHPIWPLAAASALAASAADTFATEIGTRSRHAPRSILSGRTVPAGTSGGISGLGTAGALLGAGIVACTAWATGLPGALTLVVFVAGVVGMFLDSLLGATIQAKRECPVCHLPTERTVHTCGTSTTLVGGIACIDNDAVNALTTVGASIISVGIAMLWSVAHRLVFKT